MNEEIKNLCPHCGTKLWGDVTKCYKCHKKIRVHQGINKNIFKPNIGKVNCGKCNRKVKKNYWEREYKLFFSFFFKNNI